MQLTSLAVWKTIKPGSRIVLKDTASLLAGGAEGLTYEMVRSIEVPEQEGLMTWLFIELAGPKGEARWLMIKNVDRNLDIRIYDQPPAFATGNRDDMVSQGTLWLFQEPENPDKVILNDLVYTETFEWPRADAKAALSKGDDLRARLTERSIEKFSVALGNLTDAIDERIGIDPLVHQAGINAIKSQLADLEKQAAQYKLATAVPVLYRKKAQHRGNHDMAGTPVERPRPSGDIPPQLATIAEYIADFDPNSMSPEDAARVNPEAVLLEIGSAEDDKGGLIWLLVGRNLEIGDVDVMAA